MTNNDYKKLCEAAVNYWRSFQLPGQSEMDHLYHPTTGFPSEKGQFFAIAVARFIKNKQRRKIERMRHGR